MVENTTTVEHSTIDDGMQTPTRMSINVADAYDWKHRADASERELKIEQVKFKREKRKNQRLRSLLSKCFVGWVDSIQLCHALGNSNIALWVEVQRLTSTIETLKATNSEAPSGP